MVACNLKFKELLDFPDQLFLNGLPNMAALALFNAQRGEHGPGDPAELASQVVSRAAENLRHEIRHTRFEVDGEVTALPGHGRGTSLAHRSCLAWNPHRPGMTQRVQFKVGRGACP